MAQRPIVGAGVAVVAVLVAASAARLVDADLAVAMLVLLSAVVGVSLIGRIAGLVAAVTGAVAVNWWFTPPVGSFAFDSRDDVVALVTFVVVAGVVSSLVAQVDDARRRARQRELDAELSRSRAAFFAAAGHNLRTPLATIRASASALQDAGDRLDPAERDELLETIRSETDRLTRLVDKVLSLSRIRGGGLVPEPKLVDLAGIAQVTVGRLGPLVGDRVVRIDIPPDLGPLVLDVTMLEQVLLNLLENAVRFAPPGSEVLVEASADPDGVEVRVVDHGPGVPEADRERVFEEYVRGDQQSDTPGTGLGLAIVRSLVLAQHGTVACTPTPGGGATMVVRFPVGGAPPGPPGPAGGVDRPLETTGEL